MNSQFWWYVARSGGVVAWGLATATVLWGLFLSSRVLGPRSDARKLLDLHRFLGGLTVVFTLVHVLGLLLDDAMVLGAVDVVVPMASDWEPASLALGIVAFYLLLAVEITSLLRDRVSERVWQYVHYAGFAVFLFGTIHGLRIGTDVDNPLIWWPVAIGSAAVVGLCAYRIFAGDPVHAGAQEERVPAAVLERTLSQLERLDTSSYPAAIPPAFGQRPHYPRWSPTDSDDVAGATAALTTGPAAGPTAVTPPPLSEPVTDRDGAGLADSPMFPSHSPHDFGDPPRQPPAPTRAPFDETGTDRPLPTRVPQRLTATTAPAAGLGAWAPSSGVGSRRVDVGPPPPPEGAVDPSTGEPDPQAYRKWLRDWLEYVESQP